MRLQRLALLKINTDKPKNHLLFYYCQALDKKPGNFDVSRLICMNIKNVAGAKHCPYLSLTKIKL